MSDGTNQEGENIPDGADTVKSVEDFLHKQRPILASDAPKAVSKAEEVVKVHSKEIGQNKKVYQNLLNNLFEPAFYSDNSPLNQLGIVDPVKGLRDSLSGGLSGSVDAKKLGLKGEFLNLENPSWLGLYVSNKRVKQDKGEAAGFDYIVAEGFTDSTKRVVRSYMLGPDGKTLVTERWLGNSGALGQATIGRISDIVVPPNFWINVDQQIRGKPFKLPNPIKVIRNWVRR